MRYAVASFFLLILIVPTITLGQKKSQSGSGSAPPSGTRVRPNSARNKSPSNGPIRICQGVAIPAGYTIVSYETSSACPHGAYVLKKDDSQPDLSEERNPTPTQSVTQPKSSSRSVTPVKNTTQSSAQVQTASKAVSRPRRVITSQTDSDVPHLIGAENSSDGAPRVPTLRVAGAQVSAPADNPPVTSLDKSASDEVSEGDVVRIDTNLVTLPVSVLDRQGRFVPNLQKNNFKVFEDDVEQKIAFFEPTEKPFTVALLLDTSGSTCFHLWEIKEAAITFAKQLRPQDRVLVVTFDERVMLLTEATNDQNVVTETIERNAYTGRATRLYDAIDLVINQRLNKIQGRKAIVLFTDGVDTASYGATYQSTLRQAEELDALIYPIQYDTTDFLNASQNSVTIVTTQSGNWPYSRRSTTRTYSIPSTISAPGATVAEYRLADQYLHQLADKSGARLFQANDRTQLTDAFSKIAEELRCQYSLGYYPQTTADAGERRQIRVRVDQPDLAVRAKNGYMQRAAVKTQ
jgi:Ca-activated chloride channel homolog